jgi:hypothetical protein
MGFIVKNGREASDEEASGTQLDGCGHEKGLEESFRIRVKTAGILAVADGEKRFNSR